MTEKILTINCPHCHTPIKWTTENPHRPFCSKRCQLIDLGEWVAEEKAIPCETSVLNTLETFEH